MHMGKKGSWFTTLKRAFTAPKNHQDGLHGKNVERRRWFTKSSNNVNQASTNHGSKANQYMDSVSVQRHFAATLIQTVFRGYLARKALKALKGIVMLQAMIRGQIVRNQEKINVKCMPTLHVHTRSSVDSSRDMSRMPDDQCCIPYTLEELDYILQARKEANLSHNINELQEQANYLVQWIEAEQWRRVPRKVDEVNGFLYKSQNHQSAQCIPNSPGRRSSYSPSTGQQSVTPSPIKTRPLLVHSDNPRRIKVDRNDIATPNYMAATESAKAKTRSLTSPRWTPLTPRMERVRSAKKRLSYPVPDLSHNCKVYFHGFNH